MGFSLNLLTLLAMVLAIGLVVDDAIVVVENVHRHIEEGKTPLQAALIGAREIAGPVVAMTITLAAVYAPIGFLTLTGSPVPRVRVHAGGAVIISGVVALTLSPMMCSLILKGHGAQGASPSRRPHLHPGHRLVRARLDRSLDCRGDRAVRGGRPRPHRVPVHPHQRRARARRPGHRLRPDQGAAVRNLDYADVYGAVDAAFARSPRPTPASSSTGWRAAPATASPG